MEVVNSMKTLINMIANMMDKQIQFSSVSIKTYDETPNLYFLRFFVFNALAQFVHKASNSPFIMDL